MVDSDVQKNEKKKIEAPLVRKQLSLTNSMYLKWNAFRIDFFYMKSFYLK